MKRNRDSAFAWGAVGLAVAVALAATPIDQRVRNVSIDGSISGASGAAEEMDNVLAGGSPTSPAPSAQPSTSSSPTAAPTFGASGPSTTSTENPFADPSDNHSTSPSTDFGATPGPSSSPNPSTTSSPKPSSTSSPNPSSTSSPRPSSSPSSGASGSPSPTSSPTSGPTASPSPTSSPTSRPSATPPPAPTPTPTQSTGPILNGKGVSDTQVRIGFTDLIGQQDAAAQLGISAAFPDPGNTKAQLQAVVNWANANGGIAGRELVPIVKEIKLIESSDQGEEQICTSFREDQNKDVFAAVLIGTIREQMRQCLAEGGVITIDNSAYPMTGYLYDSTVIDGIPYMWSPSYPTLNDVGEVLADHLKAMNYFDYGISPVDPCVEAVGCRLGIVMYDFPNYNRLLENEYLPRFEAIGHPIVSVQKIDSRDAGSIEAGLTNAVVGLQRDGVSRVMFMGGAPLGVFFMINAANSGYRPVYGVSTFDQPRFATDNTEPAPDQAHGMRGIGFAPTMDVHDEHWSRDKAMERLCLQIMADAGITFTDRANARIAMAYCQSVVMIKHVADKTGPNLTARTWTDGAANLGSNFQTIDGFRSFFSTKHRAGSQTFRRFAVDPACYCTKYVSANNTYDFRRFSR